MLGVANNTALTAPKDANFGPDGLLYVPADNRIARFTASGTYVDDFVPAGSGGMSQLSRIAFGPNGDLFATTSGPSSDRLYLVRDRIRSRFHSNAAGRQPVANKL